MTADWKDALAALSGLPEGRDDAAQQTSSESPKLKPKRETLHVVVEKKGRGGKIATIVEGFQTADEEVEEIARELRKRLGTGGSARGGEILIQGDRCDDVVSILRDKGFKVR